MSVYKNKNNEKKNCNKKCEKDGLSYLLTFQAA